MIPLLRMTDVSFSYPGSSHKAISGLSLKVAEGEYLAIVGSNGSGKSSLLRLAAGLRIADSGHIEVLGLDPTLKENLRIVRSTISLVFQSPPDQIVSTVVEEDVAFGPENLGLSRTEIGARVDEALQSVGLGAERKRPTHFLSAGQQQRLAIAGALAMHPRCIAFDEATAMLDPEARETVLALMDDLHASGITIIHVTHDIDEAAKAKRVIALEKGNIVFDGTPAMLFGKGPGGLSGFGAPLTWRLAIALGLEPCAGESPESLAARIAGQGLQYKARSKGKATKQGVQDGSTPGKSDSMEAVAFSAAGVDYSYLKGTVHERRAIAELDLSLRRGSVTALVGRTGSGKSTILQLLASLAAPSAGSIKAFGLDPMAKRADLRSMRMRAPFAVQRPESALFELYAGDDVSFGPRNEGLSGQDLVDRVKSAMNEVGLDFGEFRDRICRQLSGGEQRRLALSGVLALSPDALLLDEPTSALDPSSKASILKLILARARAGCTVVFATHSMEEAAMADNVAVIREGRLVAYGPPMEIFHERFDPAWGIGRPFVAIFSRELEARGFPCELCKLPLDVGIAVLADAIAPETARSGVSQ